MGSGVVCLGWIPSSNASLRQELNPLHLGPYLSKRFTAALASSVIFQRCPQIC